MERYSRRQELVALRTYEFATPQEAIDVGQATLLRLNMALAVLARTVGRLPEAAAIALGWNERTKVDVRTPDWMIGMLTVFYNKKRGAYPDFHSTSTRKIWQPPELLVFEPACFTVCAQVF